MGVFLLIHLEKPIIKRLYDHDKWVQKHIDKLITKYKNYEGDQSALLKRNQTIKKDGHERSLKSAKSEESKSNASMRSMNSFKRTKTLLFSTDSLLNFENKNYNIKNILRSDLGEKFTSVALKIALIKKQEKIAATLVLEYNCRIERPYLKMGVAADMFQFLKFLWKTEQIYYSEGDQTASDMTFDVAVSQK